VPRIRPAAKHLVACALWLPLFGCLLNVRSAAQIRAEVPAEAYATRQTQTAVTYDTAPNTAVLVFRVLAGKDALDRSARLDLTNLANHRAVFQIVPSHSNAVFTNVVLGKYDLAATAVGYLTTRREVIVLSPLTQHIDIVLRRDPAAVTLNEASGFMPRKARKAAHRAISFLKSGQLAGAQKHLETAYKLAPSNADLNFLLGYLHLEKKDYAQARTYLRTAASLSPHSAQTLTLLGKANLLERNYPAARSALEQAVLVDAEEWLPHCLLADAYLQEKEYAKARDEAQTAIAKGARLGKNAAAAAEIVRGQALIALGQKDEGTRALEAFVKGSPQNPMADPVRDLLARLKTSEPISAARGGSIVSEISTPPVSPIEAVPKPVLSMESWRPPDIDDAKPAVTPGVACPAKQVFAETGKRVQELVQDLSRFAADEDLFHESLDGAGFSKDAETRKYNYVAALSPQAGAVFIEEYRSDRIPQAGAPDAITSAGFAVLALVFHPEMQGDFDFDCEGQGQWQGQPSWLVHFRQRSDRPNRMHAYSVGGESFPVDLKGRAWISAATFQIMRIEADIVKPAHKIQLLSEHQAVEYGPVPFAGKNTMLWLPKKAEIYFDFRKHHYYRRHSFDNYQLFSVETEQKDKVPQAGTPASDRSKEKGPS
jgi:tetratricopeptide (TPR) repeat protein